MSVLRLYANKNNTIASGVFKNFNSGQNAATDLWFGGSGQVRNSISRFLIYFSLDELISNFKSGNILSGNVKSYTLKMVNSLPSDVSLENQYDFDVLTKQIASSYDLISFPINKKWDEGKGYDLLYEDYVVKQKGNPQITGFSNWNYATSTEKWDSPGVFLNPYESSTYTTYSGESNYDGVFFIKTNSKTEEIYEFSINSDVTSLEKDEIKVTGSSIEYTYNPLSGNSIPDSYSGIEFYNGISFKKMLSTEIEGFNFTIESNTGITSEYNLLVTTGSSIGYTYNPLSGSPTTFDYQTGLTSFSGFSNLNIQVSGGNNSNSISSTTFNLLVKDLVSGYTENYVPTTLDYVNSLNLNMDYLDLGINNTSGNSETNLSNGSFEISATSIDTSINYSSTQHFDLGDENINMDITDMVKSWIDGSLENNGLGISFSREFELISGGTRNISSFFTSKTNSFNKPYIEVEYEQTINDDRDQFTNNRLNRIFLYTYSGNSNENYYSAGTVTIKSPSGESVITGLTPNQLSKGVYYVDVFLPNSTRGQRYSDIWEGVTFSPGYDKQDYIQHFVVKDNYYLNSSPRINEYTLNVYGIEGNSILRDDEIIRVFANLRVNYSQKSPSPNYDLKYRVIMNNQDEVIPWVSVNKVVRNNCKEQYFDLDTSWLLNNQTYSIEFRIEELGSKRVLPNKVVFSVKRPF